MLEDEGSTAEVVEESMDDTLRDALQSIKSRGVEIEDKPAEVESVEAKAERLRDESGKFAAKPVETTVAAETPVEAAPVVEATPVAVPPELQRLGLRKEAAEAFMQAPQVLRDEFTRRADEMGRGIEQYKQAAQFAQSMQAVISPHMDTINGLGVTPDVAVGKLLEADRTLRHGSPEQKQAMFAQIARDYGVQLEGMQNMQPVDPYVQALQQQVQQIQKQFQTQEQQREAQVLNSQIESFRTDPNHSHFDKVRGLMGALIQAGLAPDLKGAYEQAVWASPEIRTSLIAQQQEAARAEATKKAQEAKQAASVNVRKRSAMPVSEPIGTMDDTIRATLRKLQAA